MKKPSSNKPNPKTNAVLKSAKHDKKSDNKNSVRQAKPSRSFIPRRKDRVLNVFKKPKTKPQYRPLPKARLLLVAACQLLLKSPKAILGIVAIYLVSTIIFVSGLALSSNLLEARAALQTFFGDKLSGINSYILQTSYLFSNNGNPSSATGRTYQSIIMILCSLAIIWAVRQLHSGKTISTKRSFYEGMDQLIPFVLTVVIVSLQLLPLSIGAFLYDMLVSNGILVHTYERVIAVIIFALLALWSLSMITYGFIAVYISTLKGLQPLVALRSAKDLVKYRKLLIWRKYIFLPIVLIVATVLLVSPFVLFMPVLAPWVFVVLGGLSFVIFHAYMYCLYRELLPK